MAERRPDDLLNDALDLDPAERASFLDEACAGDQALRADVESLLSLHARAAGLLQLPASYPTSARPERIGHYSILDVLGHGGMGIVYLAEDPRLERRVALKVLPQEFAWDPTRCKLFESEARLLAELNHPNIATIYTLEDADGVTFLTMEYVEGHTLADSLRDGRMEIDRALRISRQIARALEAAHENGVVHRDLKPANIMLTPKDQVKLLDFGLAKSLLPVPSPHPPDLPRARDVIGGTPGYASPEQLRSRPADHRTDIWAFGCILYECLTGQPAFAGSTPAELMKATLRLRPDWRRLPEKTPASLTEVLELCLLRPPAKRLGRIRTARRVIEQCLAQQAYARRQARAAAWVSSVSGNLPATLDSLVGRGRELIDVQRLLSENRHVTLTGAGGCGKTRLAIETGRSLVTACPDGIWMVGLASLTDPASVPQAAAGSLGLCESPNRTTVDILLTRISQGRMLLILDNCEHLVGACRELVTRLLGACPNLRVLATSREPLRADGESVYRVPSLAIPPRDTSGQLDQIAQIESVHLFVDRARLIRHDFVLTQTNANAVSEVCRQLDGIPLAIELAAARVAVLPVDEIARRMEDQFRLLTTTSETRRPRQRTLRALVEWSYDLLTEAEQQVFRRLSIFAGGWSLEAAEDVCAGRGVEGWEILDLLSLLLDKSMVELDGEVSAATGQARYRMLETVRQYGRDRLSESRELVETRKKHRDHFLVLAESAGPRLFGPEQGRWFARLRADHENLRQALNACASAEFRTAMRLAAALGPYWMSQGHWTEGRSAYASLLARTSASRAPRLQALVFHWAANLAECQGDLDRAEELNENALALRRRLRNRTEIARSLNNLGNVNHRLGNLERAVDLYREALAIQRELGHRLDIAHILNNLGALAGEQRRLAEARSFIEESLSIKREIADRTAVARSLNNLGTLAAMQEDWLQARQYFEEALTIQRELGDTAGVASILANLGELDSCLAVDARAASHFREAASILWRLGNPPKLAEVMRSMAAIAVRMGEHAFAARLIGAVDAILTTSPLSGMKEDGEFESLKVSVSATLGDDAFERESLRGREMGSERVVDLWSENRSASPRIGSYTTDSPD